MHCALKNWPQSGVSRTPHFTPRSLIPKQLSNLIKAEFNKIASIAKRHFFNLLVGIFCDELRNKKLRHSPARHLMWRLRTSNSWHVSLSLQSVATTFAQFQLLRSFSVAKNIDLTQTSPGILKNNLKEQNKRDKEKHVPIHITGDIMCCSIVIIILFWRRSIQIGRASCRERV